jgi:hypothetical protein
MSHIDGDEVVEVDVHAILDRGDRPFDPIMDALDEVSSDGALRVLAPFKPSPLIRVVGRQGWEHWFERGEGSDWVVWFYRPA